MVHPADVDGANAPIRLFDQTQHRSDVTDEQQARLGARLQCFQIRGGIGHRVELHGHFGRHAHAIELLLPLTGCHFIVDKHDKAKLERLSPADHDLSVNETIVDSIQLNGHAFRNRGRPSMRDRARGRIAPR